MVASDFNSNKVPGQDSSTQYLDVRAIVLSGEASQTAFEELRSAIREVLPQLQEKVRDTIDPLFVPAIGAARRAREFVQSPEKWRFPSEETPCPGHNGANLDHDEL